MKSYTVKTKGATSGNSGLNPFQATDRAALALDYNRVNEQLLFPRVERLNPGEFITLPQIANKPIIVIVCDSATPDAPHINVG